MTNNERMAQARSQVKQTNKRRATETPRETKSPQPSAMVVHNGGSLATARPGRANGFLLSSPYRTLEKAEERTIVTERH